MKTPKLSKTEILTAIATAAGTTRGAVDVASCRIEDLDEVAQACARQIHAALDRLPGGYRTIEVPRLGRVRATTQRSNVGAADVLRCLDDEEGADLMAPCCQGGYLHGDFHSPRSGPSTSQQVALCLGYKVALAAVRAEAKRAAEDADAACAAAAQAGVRVD